MNAASVNAASVNAVSVNAASLNVISANTGSLHRIAVLAAICVLAAACSSTSIASDPTPPDEVPARVDQAEQQLEAGETQAALDLLRDLREVRGVEAESRARIDLLIERGAEQRYRELSQPGNNPKRLLDQLEMNLPRQLAVTSGITAAEMYLDQGKRMKSFRAVEKVDKRFPPAGTHHERVRAGRILFDAGTSMADDRWSILGFFRTSDKGKQVLQYLVDTYPSAERCDEAYAKLGELYERDRRWALAREYYEDLLRWHPSSPLAPASEARIPHLRLLAIRSPEYDRQELLRAREEIERWLKRHPDFDDEELVLRVRTDYADVLRRLVENDLVVAAFYERIDEPHGARLHAERALKTAKRTQDEDLIARVQTVIEGLPPDDRPGMIGPELPEMPGSGG